MLVQQPSFSTNRTHQEVSGPVRVIRFLEEAANHGTDGTGKKTELSSIEFSCVEKKLELAFQAGLVQHMLNKHVTLAFCRLMSCANEKRAHQFSVAITHVIRRGRHPEYLAHQVKGYIYHHSSGSKSLVTGGVDKFIDYMINKI